MTRSAGEKPGPEDREKRRGASSKWAAATGNVEETFEAEDEEGTTSASGIGRPRDFFRKLRDAGIPASSRRCAFHAVF